VSLDVDALLFQAEQESGLNDWGEDQSFREGLIQLTSAARSARLPERAVAQLRQQIVQLLILRLRLIRDEREHPEIGRLEIERPLILTGLARTGTTILHDLCALAPDCRAPQQWEADEPWPAPEAATYTTDPRIAKTQAAIDARLAAMPILKTMHPWGATLPADCLSFLAVSFVTTRFMASFYVPEYTHWLSVDRPQGMYRTHKRLLQQLQWRGPQGRWTLKEPQHLLHLPELIKSYPDACIVQTHRDPIRTLPSVASLIWSIQVITKPDIDKKETGRQVLEVFGAHLDRCVQARRDAKLDAHILDVPYRDTVVDPIGQVRRIHEHFELPFHEEHARRIERHLVEHAQGKHGVHQYTAEEFGMDSNALKRLAPEYRERFGHLLSEPER